MPKESSPMPALVEEIFVASRGGERMKKVEQVQALSGRGLEGDRYCERTGYWTAVDECQVTLIEAEDLEEIERLTNVLVRNGEHRRNLITREIRLETLQGKRFEIGGAILEFDRPRPPCSYIQSLTQPEMTRALVGRGGICARVIQSGPIHANDPIIVLPPLGK